MKPTTTIKQCNACGNVAYEPLVTVFGRQIDTYYREDHEGEFGVCQKCLDEHHEHDGAGITGPTDSALHHTTLWIEVVL